MLSHATLVASGAANLNVPVPQQWRNVSFPNWPKHSGHEPTWSGAEMVVWTFDGGLPPELEVGITSSAR